MIICHGQYGGLLLHASLPDFFGNSLGVGGSVCKLTSLSMVKLGIFSHLDSKCVRVHVSVPIRERKRSMLDR